MGIEFTLAYIPCTKMTTERIQILHDIVDTLSDYELKFQNEACDSDEHTREEIIALLHYHVEALRDAEDYWRHVNHIYLPELPYTILAAGGYSHGDSPSEQYESFCMIGDCGPLLSQLVEWAEHDFQKRVK